jgi:signal transduction histidine kinase
MTIKLKLFLVLIFCLGSTGGVGYLGYDSYVNLQNINKDLRQASKIKGLVQAIANSPFYPSFDKKLKRYVGRLKPNYRNRAFKKIVMAYGERNRRKLNSSIVTFRKQEKKYTAYLEANLLVYESRIESLALALVTSFGLSLFFIYSMILNSTFRPLKALSNRMLDFLNDRYTYQFRVPKKNEVGELELNFHSLAQRVLNNIEELKALDSAKSDFLNIASHELRTPLTSIKGSLSLLRTGMDKLPKEKSAKLFSIAEKETDRLIRLINDLLDLAKIEAGKLPLEKDWVSIDEVVETTLYSLEGISKTAGVSLAYTSGQHKLVDIDQDKVQQVITNLVSNAIKYSPDNGTVTVAVSINTSNHLKIEIKDEGAGISPSDQKLIFEKFRQASGPANPIVKGTGLGLAIARAVIEEHKGVIGVQSQVGKGSSFFFTLPDWKQSEVTMDFGSKKAA